MQNSQQHSSQSPVSSASEEERQQARITELETRLLFMEDTVDQLNEELANLSHDFLLARQAMQLMNTRIEQLLKQDGQLQGGDEAPPPHY